MFGLKRNEKVQTPEQQRQTMLQWEALQKKGQLYFVIRHGLINWALMTSVIYFVLIFFSNKFQMSLLLFTNMLPTFGLFALGGILFGLVMWRISEKKYSAIALRMANTKKTKKK